MLFTRVVRGVEARGDRGGLVPMVIGIYLLTFLCIKGQEKCKMQKTMRGMCLVLAAKRSCLLLPFC
jgi:hypothetical protein